MKYKDTPGLDAKFDNKPIEDRCMEFWEKNGVYKYDPSRPRDETFAIDTPPPTVSGSLHIGHIMGYAQTDISARAQRMFGKNVFFPIGWDDNGLPTERRVQNYFSIKCDPTLPYDPDFKPEHKESKDTDEKRAVSRRNFIEACWTLISQDEKVFESIFRRMGYSYDWSLTYVTISDTAIKLAQEAFLNFYEKGDAKSVEAPTMWDSMFQTAVAQAEVEDREVAGFFHDIKFKAKTGGEFVIATTRPEFLPACIAIVAHPDDARYKHLFGKNAIVPLFGFEVPVMASEHADPEKGTGIMMVCTFGDAEDVKFWRAHGLPLKQIIGRDGKIIDTGFLKHEKFDALVGLPVKAARKAVVEMLRESGDLAGEPRPITHSVKFYEKNCSTPLEFVPSRQWFVSLTDKKEKLIAQGRKIEWIPEHMRGRFENWTDGLNQEWAISRQRFFGVPFPVWYKLDAAGNPDFGNPIIAPRNRLSVDPMTDAPEGFKESQRGQPGGFMGDPDIMDTWATSSLTPQIAMAMAGNPAGLSLPFDARNSGPEIIRTWNFYTIAQDMINAGGEIPWKRVWINGWVLDPDRKKMSKSKGNVVVPTDIVEKYGADAIRLWAGSLKWGTDAAFDEKILDQKRKLVMKFFNAAKFVLGFAGETKGAAIAPDDNPVDLVFWNKMTGAVKESGKCFSQNDYAGALVATEQAFWDFCDNYLEIAKGRAYAGDDSALKSLRYATTVFCAMFAPFMPFIAEEVWQANPYKKEGGVCDMTSVHKSLHPSVWPEFSNGDFAREKAGDYDLLCELVSAVRGRKSADGKSVKFPIAKLVVADNKFFRAAATDIRNVLNVAELEFAGAASALVGELVWGE